MCPSITGRAGLIYMQHVYQPPYSAGVRVPSLTAGWNGIITAPRYEYTHSSGMPPPSAEPCINLSEPFCLALASAPRSGFHHRAGVDAARARSIRGTSSVGAAADCAALGMLDEVMYSSWVRPLCHFSGCEACEAP